MDAEEFSISLPADVARMVRRQVETCAYASDSEVIHDALRLWQDRHEERGRRLDIVRAKINEASNDAREITDEALRQHFERRFAEAERKRPA